MGYYKRIKMSIEEAIEFETKAGFESHDEFKEVMQEIADEYNVDVGVVYDILGSTDIELVE
jgi:predicted DNA-binding protein YlxM (UPF0122 family)